MLWFLGGQLLFTTAVFVATREVDLVELAANRDECDCFGSWILDAVGNE